MGKLAFWTISFQCLAKSPDHTRRCQNAVGGIYIAFVLLSNFLTAALTCEQARGKCARNGRGDREGSRTTPFPIPLLNRAHSGYNSMLILFFVPRPNKGTLPLLLITTEASLQLSIKERALGPNLKIDSKTPSSFSLPFVGLCTVKR